MIIGPWKDLENVAGQNNKAKRVKTQTSQVIQRTELTFSHRRFTFKF
jgi:hypothetical protein